jgi:hypothetical protein
MFCVYPYRHSGGDNQGYKCKTKFAKSPEEEKRAEKITGHFPALLKKRANAPLFSKKRAAQKG